MKDYVKVAYLLVVILDSYWARMNFLSDFLKETRERQVSMVLLIEFQINGSWVLIVFSAILGLV